MKRPATPVNIAALAHQAGCIIERDRISDCTKVFTLGGMEIEFLITQQGGGDKAVLPTHLGVNAQALRHMDVIKNNRMCVNVRGMEISVPTPEAYALHKMMINGERGKKAEKDRRAILQLLPFLDKRKLQAIMQTLTAKERKAVEVFYETIETCLFNAEQ